VGTEVATPSGERDVRSGIDWIGGQLIGDTTLRKVNRTTAQTIIEADLPVVSPAVARDVEVWVENQMYNMPLHIKAGVALVAFVITVEATLRHGRPQWRLPAATRRRLLERWSNSRLVPVSQYVRLVRSLAVYGAYEHPAGPRRTAG
jgi:hypothetical protein